MILQIDISSDVHTHTKMLSVCLIYKKQTIVMFDISCFVVLIFFYRKTNLKDEQISY